MTWVLFLISTILRHHYTQVEQRIINIFTENKLKNKIISVQDATWLGDLPKHFIDSKRTDFICAFYDSIFEIFNLKAIVTFSVFQKPKVIV
jgi:hypothetical protein